MKRYLIFFAAAVVLSGCGDKLITPLSFAFSSSQDPESLWHDAPLSEVLLSNGHHIHLEIANGVLSGEYSGGELGPLYHYVRQKFVVDLSSVRFCGESADFKQEQEDDSVLEHSISSWPNHSSGVGCIVQDILIKRAGDKQETERSAELFFVHNGLVDRADTYSWDDPFWKLQQTKIRVLAPR